jgi:hypothetical protein
MRNDIEIYIQKTSFRLNPFGGFEATVCDYREGKLMGIAEPVTFNAPADVNRMVDPPPTFHFSDEAAQILMNDLWYAGVRPVESSLGSLSATTKHLNDMRALVSNTLKVTLP